MQILVSGSLAYDRIMDFPERFSDHILPDKIHILNVCFMVNGLKEQFGGTAGNIAYSLHLLGANALILAAAGKDFHSYKVWLQKNGLPLTGIREIPEEFTAGAYITTDIADNQITGFNPGAMKHQCGYQIDGIDPSDALAIISPGNLDDMYHYSKVFKAKGISYICDPGQSIPALPKDHLLEMIEGSRLLISNDYELEMIVRSTGVSKKDLLSKTNSIITTLAEKGCTVATAGSEVEIPASKPAKVSDPTGAGDAFRAGLIKGIIEGKSLEDSARMGSVSAAFSVECQGTQCHHFTIEQFNERYAENFS
jgi:adenosine kinase